MCGVVGISQKKPRLFSKNRSLEISYNICLFLPYVRMGVSRDSGGGTLPRAWGPPWCYIGMASAVGRSFTGIRRFSLFVFKENTHILNTGWSISILYTLSGTYDNNIIIKCTVCERRKVTPGFYRNSQPIISLHGSVICHMNGNFVSFQNMCEFERSDL